MASLGPCDSLTVRAYLPGDESAILELEQRLRGGASLGPGESEAWLAHWRWRHLANPAGQRVWVACNAVGAMAQAVCGVPRRVQFDGRESTWVSLAQWLRDPGLGRRMDRAEWRTLTARAWLAAGADDFSETLVYGFPNRSTQRIARTDFGAEVIRSQGRLRLTRDRFASCAEQALDARDSAFELQVFGVRDGLAERAPGELAELGQRCAREHGAMVLRDRAYLEWRYVQHPSRDFEVLAVRKAGVLVGLALTTVGCAERRVVEWLVDPELPVTGSVLLAAAARSAAAARECEVVTALLPEYGPHWALFQRAGFRVEGTGAFLVGRSSSGRHGERWLFRNWFYTLGDTNWV